MSAKLRSSGRNIVDHRGRVMSLDRHPYRIPADELQHDVCERIRLAVNRGYFGRHGWRAIVLLGLTAGLTYLSIEVSPHVVNLIGGQRMAGWWGWFFPLMFGALLAVIVCGALALERRLAAKRLWNALLEEHHCPRCLYALVGLHAKEDGCTVCPECSAAWRLSTRHSVQR